MATVLDTLQKGTDYLEKKGVENGRLNMQHLIAHVLRCDRMQVYVDFDRELTEPQLDSLRELTRSRARGEPLQHLLGTVEFCGLEFRTDNRALIPRPETEELTTHCAALSLGESPRILDLGCGSGVIGLSLAHLLRERNPSIWLSDISGDALDLARENMENLALSDGVTLVEGDLFSALDGVFSLIVANLPYVSLREKTSLSREVQRDPESALYGGEEGTELIERFFESVEAHVQPGSQVALEYGIGQAEAIEDLAGKAGFGDLRIVRDLSGIDRFLFASYQPIS